MISTVSAGCVISVAERRGAYWILVVRADGRRPLGRPRYRWKNNVRMDRQEVG
jgi:RNase P/RNase MRP subunit p29